MSDSVCGMTENTMSALTKMVVDKIVQGYSLEEASEQSGISTTEGVKVWKKYVAEREEMPAIELYLLHQLRLEKLLTHVYTLAMHGNDPDNIDNMIKLLDRIEALQDLNKSRVRDAQNELTTLTRQQAALMIQAFIVYGEGMKQKIEQALENKTIKAIKGELLSDYDTISSELTQNALSALEEMENAG